jgi:hypothetical protein
MKNVLILPLVLLATASFVSVKILFRPLRAKFHKGKKAEVENMQKFFYLSRR